MFGNGGSELAGGRHSGSLASKSDHNSSAMIPCAGRTKAVADGVEAVEVVVGADLVGESEAVQFAAEVVAGLGDGEDDPAPLQVVGQLEQGLGAGVVDVVDRLGLEDEPVRRVSDVDQAHDVLGEALGVGVEDPDREPVDDQAGLGDRARGGRGQPDVSLGVEADHRVVGGEVPLDVHDQRQHDRQDDALLDPEDNDDDRRIENLRVPQAGDDAARGIHATAREPHFACCKPMNFEWLANETGESTLKIQLRRMFCQE